MGSNYLSYLPSVYKYCAFFLNLSSPNYQHLNISSPIEWVCVNILILLLQFQSYMYHLIYWILQFVIINAVEFLSSYISYEMVYTNVTFESFPWPIWMRFPVCPSYILFSKVKINHVKGKIYIYIYSQP